MPKNKKNALPQMVYGKDEKIVVLDARRWHKLQYAIISHGTHICGYVEIPPSHLAYKNPNFDFSKFPSPREISYFGGGYWLSLQERKYKYFIGWKYTDFEDWNGRLKDEENKYLGKKKVKRKEVFADIKKVVDYIYNEEVK